MIIFLSSVRTTFGMQVFFTCVLIALSIDSSHARVTVDHGKIYHVIQILGDDKNEGTAAKPFATISKCAIVARAGDTCIVHAGTYRETVRPLRSGKTASPITFLAATGEKARVTGLDRLTSVWNRRSATIFSTKLRLGAKQLFINDEQMTIARYPNTDHYFKPTYAIITSAKCRTDTGAWSSDTADCQKHDEDGPCSRTNNCWNRSFPKILWQITSNGLPESTHWQGGIISIVDKGSYNAESAVITQSNPGNKIEFEYFSEKGLEPGMKFFITNSVAAIDSAGEWSYNPSSQELYFDPPGADIPPGISIRTRDLAFDLRGKSHIIVKGFEIFAASIETGPDSTGCILDRLDVSYPVYYQMFGAKKNFPGQGPNRHNISLESMGKGITLGGNNNTLQNSKISHSWCDGVTVYGSHNYVMNNEVSDVNWGMTACAAVATNGDHHQVKSNRLHDCGRSCLWHQKTFDSEFSYNDIFNACWLGKDCGVTGSYGWYGKTNHLSSDADGDGIGNSIHHNWIHDNRSAHGGACLYLDNDEQDYLVHHNVIWGCQTAFIMNDTCIAHGVTGHQAFNNTCFDVEFRISDFGKDKNWKLQGVKFSNNLCTTSRDAHYNAHNAAEIVMESNIGPGNANQYASPNPAAPWKMKDLGLMDPGSRDFRPGEHSPARHQGEVVPGVTNKAQGIPSAGAYEYGLKEAWKAGPVSVPVK